MPPVLAVVCVAVLGALLSPIVHNLGLPPDYPNRVSEHPEESPHVPMSYPIPAGEIQAFQRDGIVVLRDVIPHDLALKLDVAGDDLVDVATRHCELTKWTGPPIFHAYHRYCGRAQLIHDYLRDVVYKSPLAHVAAQLLNVTTTTTTTSSATTDTSKEPLRQVADVFMAGTKLPKRWHSDFLSFVNFAKHKDTSICRKSVIFWMPLQPTTEATNGLVLLNHSSREFEQHFVSKPQQSRNVFRYMKWLNKLDKTTTNNPNYIAPTVDLGDVIAFDACVVHASSGQHANHSDGRIMRRAYQLRFLKDFELTPTQREPWWKQFLLPSYKVNPVASPQLWPITLQEEDSIRQTQGHVIYSRWEWIKRLSRGPGYTLFNSLLHWCNNIFGDDGSAQ